MRPIVIAGGGLAGAAVACLLARAGRSVQLIERERQAKHKVCGEFISCEAQAYLSDMGMDLAAWGAAPITHLRLARGNRVVTTKLPFQGLSLSRRILDDALLRRAETLGAEVLRGHAVRQVEGMGVPRLIVDDVGVLEPETFFLASGKHDIRGASRQTPMRDNDLIGLKSYFKLAPLQQHALQQAVEIVLFRGGYAGLQMIEGHLANLCLLVRRDRFSAVDNDWQALLTGLMAENAHLRMRLAAAVDQFERPLAIARIPYGFLHKPTCDDPATLFRLGDQMAVTPSFSGDGMSIALHTAFAAAESYLLGQCAERYHQRMRQEIGPQIRRAGLLSAALLNNAGQAGAMALAQIVPSILRSAANVTRLPGKERRSPFNQAA
jgi:flavin-dependent dehydrogenase